jgi:hypothetical protein
MNQPSRDDLDTLVRPGAVPRVDDDARPSAPPSACPTPGLVSLGVKTRGRLTAAPRPLWACLLIVAAIGIVWYLQQWIGGLMLLIGLLGWGAWRLADAFFRPSALADVEVRDGDRGRTAERVTISQKLISGL